MLDLLDRHYRVMAALSTDATRHLTADADHLSILAVLVPVHARELATRIAALLDTDH